MKKDKQKNPETEVKEAKVSREISQEELEQVIGGSSIGVNRWKRPIGGASSRI